MEIMDDKNVVKKTSAKSPIIVYIVVLKYESQ